MKDKYIRIRTSERRLNKLRLYAASKEKTMTQIIEDFIDSLPSNIMSGRLTVIRSTVN